MKKDEPDQTAANIKRYVDVLEMIDTDVRDRFVGDWEGTFEDDEDAVEGHDLEARQTKYVELIFKQFFEDQNAMIQRRTPVKMERSLP